MCDTALIIHYNASIADGYTLKLIREEIENNYKIVLRQALERIKVLYSDIKKEEVFSHHSFVDPMLEYIVKDFEKARLTFDDSSIGAMVVCDSAEQARQMYKIFNEKYAENIEYQDMPMAAEDQPEYEKQYEKPYKVKTADLILYDAGTKVVLNLRQSNLLRLL